MREEQPPHISTERLIAVKKFVATLALASLSFGLAACGSTNTSDDVIKIGVVGTDPVNDKLVEVAKENGLTVELVEFSTYTEPNPALASGDIDMNWFQHIAYLSNYNVEAGEDLQIVGPTVIYPMALFSQQYESLADLPDGAEIAIPNDTVNEARALRLLEANSLVVFKGEPAEPTVDDVDTEASKVSVIPVDAAQTVISMESVAGSVINNDFLKDAGLNPQDALAQDDPANPSAQPYVNLFVAQAEDADNEDYKKIAELFHTEPVIEVMKEETKNTGVEVNTDVSELRETLKTLTEQKQQ